jgi:hypothetical protein
VVALLLVVVMSTQLPASLIALRLTPGAVPIPAAVGVAAPAEPVPGEPEVR